MREEVWQDPALDHNANVSQRDPGKRILGRPFFYSYFCIEMVISQQACDGSQLEKVTLGGGGGLVKLSVFPDPELKPAPCHFTAAIGFVQND